ncbi:MAG: hypothetical protein M1829_000560 [Trizodia sp. TS-e1964]|nr:MAG: hypothetical protein M1829_000560 [Trizodia sp. TS-e1964]
MDVAGLRDCIRLTLDPNSDIRRRAELDLKVAEDLPGFLDALLNILEAEQDAPIRLSTVVYLKNRVNRGWSPSPDPPIHKAIAVDEKLRFRERIIPLVAASPPQIRQQLLPMLQKILNIDFPGSWPSFLDITLQLLNTNDANSIYTGLQCILGICKVFRFKAADDRSDFEKIVALSFPRLLIIGNDLVNGSSNEVGEMLRTVMKAFKHAIYVSSMAIRDLPFQS